MDCSKKMSTWGRGGVSNRSKIGKNADVVYGWSPNRMEAAEASQFSQEKAIIFNWIMCLLEPTVSSVCISTSETN